MTGVAKHSSDLERDISQVVNGGVRSGDGFEMFASWPDVLAAARRGDRLWYQAALDVRPRAIAVDRVFKNGKIRIDPLSNQADKFTADVGHLDRFRRRVLANLKPRDLF